MTSGGNNFNDLPENQLTTFQLGCNNVKILHTFAAVFQYYLSTAGTAETESCVLRCGLRDVRVCGPRHIAPAACSCYHYC